MFYISITYAEDLAIVQNQSQSRSQSSYVIQVALM